MDNGIVCVHSEEFMKTLMIILFSVTGIFGQATIGTSIDYKIKPIPQIDRTDLEISIQFKMEKEKTTTIKLAPGCYGTPDIYKYVTSFDGKDGTIVTKSAKKTERTVRANSKGEALIKYVLSFDPKIIEDSAFAPKIHQNYFSIAGCQWMLRIGDDEEKRDVSVEIVDAPKDWNFHSSIKRNATNIRTKASYSDLLSARIGGGGDSHTFYVKNKPVSVFIKGEFDIPKHKIFAAVEKIVRIQRDWFEDYEQPFYNVVINERKGVVAGTAVANQFVCFVRPEVDEVALNMILAHEMFHNWLSIKMEFKLPEGHWQIRHEWFFEGFTEYFAKKILYDAGLLSPEQFADLINKDIHNLADNPHKSISYSDLLAVAKARAFTSDHKKLSYYRGVLIALKWETLLRNSKNNNDLSKFIQKLFKFISNKNEKISEGDFFEFAKGYGIDAKADFETYILEGKAIEVASDALGKDFTSTEQNVPSFEIGFSFGESRRTGKISGVIKNSAAEKAGLRNGMKYVRAKNAWRFSNSWNSEKPLSVIVKIDEKERKIEYFPHGKAIRLLQFQPK
jgi:predicted metalloprotease with PDZ domain